MPGTLINLLVEFGAFMRMGRIRNKMPSVCVLILCDSSDTQLTEMTQRAIDLYRNSYHVRISVILVESGRPHSYDGVTHILQPGGPFHYNKFLRIGIEYILAKVQCSFIVISNNDVLVNSLAIYELVSSGALSSSPVDPVGIFSNSFWRPRVGYSIEYHLTGWCICCSTALFHRYSLDSLFPDDYPFFRQDDYYGNFLEKSGVSHLVIPSAKVVHLGHQSHKLADPGFLE
jgi:hypothetical protein